VASSCGSGDVPSSSGTTDLVLVAWINGILFMK
jgi:hypothetical protein